ncbi:MAG: ATP synthase F0 subunit B [Bdellovibrionales bacterium]|nr:ATP synthase F0 subunit B [Bdellovibrionales bacterium]
MSLRWIYLILLLFVMGTSALASSGAEAGHHDGGIPDVVFRQAINFGIFALLLHFLLRKSVVGFFANRLQEFNKKANAAQDAKKEAEIKKSGLVNRLSDLNSTEGSSMEKAQKEAAELKSKILAESQRLATQIKTDAKKTAELEFVKAQDELMSEFLGQVLETAEGDLKSKVTSSDQKRFQQEFVSRVKAVH